MNTKMLLIVFAVLLVLLTLLSAFGGTLQLSESFYQDHPFHELFHEGTFVKPIATSNKNKGQAMNFGDNCSSSDPSCMTSTLGHVTEQFIGSQNAFSNNSIADTNIATINPLSNSSTASINAINATIAYKSIEPFEEIAEYSLI